MPIDGKYGRVQLEHGTIGKNEPVFIFRAQDELLPELLFLYHELCERNGSPQRHLDAILRSRDEILRWQEGNHTQTPQSAPHAEREKEENPLRSIQGGPPPLTREVSNAIVRAFCAATVPSEMTRGLIERGVFAPPVPEDDGE